MAHRRVLAGVLATLLLAGCGGTGGTGGTDQQASEPRDDTTTEAASTEQAGPGAKLLDTGFGQDGEYAWVTSLVQNQSEDNVGHFVTVQFNAYDKGGKLIASAEQVEAFYRADQKLAIGTQVEIEGKKKVAKVEATLAVGDETGSDTDPSLEIKTGKVKVVDDYGTTAQFEVYNPTKEALKDVRIGVICYDTKDRVNGGGSDYPDLIPPSGKVLSKTYVIVSGKTDRCDAYAAPAGF